MTTSNTIRLKRNSIPNRVPSSGQLVSGELAVNTYDGKVYLRKEDNAVIDIVAAQTSGVYAPLISPSFTGIPIGPNPSISSNSNQLATTNFVQSIFSTAQNTLSRSTINVTTNNYSSFNIPGGYVIGRLDLFQNGVKLLENSDFTASDGTSVNLSKVAPSGSSLEYLVNYTTSSYATFSGISSPTGNFASLTTNQFHTAQRYTEIVNTININSNNLNINLNNGNLFNCLLNSNINTVNIQNAPTSQGSAIKFTTIFTGDGISRSVSWPNSIKWPGGISPTLTYASGKIDMFNFTSIDNGTTWLGFIAGQNY
jgi:hypothetical protein